VCVILFHFYSMVRQQRDKLVLTVKYSKSNLCSMVNWIRLKIYWWSWQLILNKTKHSKYSQLNLWFIMIWIRLKIYWWSLIAFYSMTCCWLYSADDRLSDTYFLSVRLDHMRLYAIMHMWLRLLWFGWNEIQTWLFITLLVKLQLLYKIQS
jgi:hypothetical protein